MLGRATRMIEFRNNLTAIGFSDETIAEAIRLGEDTIPVYSCQLSGCYIRPDGTRYAHYATPGMYRIVGVEGESVTIRKIDLADPFVFCAKDLLAVLEPNLKCLEEDASASR